MLLCVQDILPSNLIQKRTNKLAQMAKEMVNQTYKVCKFCECNCVKVLILAGERENDDKNVSSDEGDVLHCAGIFNRRTS